MSTFVFEHRFPVLLGIYLRVEFLSHVVILFNSLGGLLVAQMVKRLPAVQETLVRSLGWDARELALRIRWPKYLSFIFSISPSKEHPGLISFRMDWLDLLAV